MYPNAKISEQTAVLGSIDPVSQGVGAVSTGWIGVAGFERFLAFLQTGILGAGATVDAKLQQATSSAGANAKDITGKAITQIVKATGDAKQAQIDLRADELDINNSFAFFRLTVTVGTAASLIAATVEGASALNQPASANNLATVVQTV